jgi:hypothetical protein
MFDKAEITNGKENPPLHRDRSERQRRTAREFRAFADLRRMKPSRVSGKSFPDAGGTFRRGL